MLFKQRDYTYKINADISKQSERYYTYNTERDIKNTQLQITDMHFFVTVSPGKSQRYSFCDIKVLKSVGAKDDSGHFWHADGWFDWQSMTSY